MQDVRFEVTSEPNLVYAQALEDGLTAFNLKTRGHERENSFCFAHGDNGLYGGISGSQTGKKFHIRHLWVDESRRGQGFGRALFKQMEDAARLKGCTEIYVDTMSFQAPEFYNKLGFAEIARVCEFYAGHDRIFFRKEIL